MRLDQETGYLSDIPYTAGVYAEQAPSLLSYVCAINGVTPPSLDRGFAYCELGCAFGVTLNALAAANPDGEFHGIDFNPGHIAEARRLAREGGLANVHFHETTFAEALTRDLPEFDFIALHGVLSWVPQDVRSQIVGFVQRKLKPGGVMYVSYNAMPGWSPYAPLRHLLASYAATVPGTTSDGLKAAVEWLNGLVGQDGIYVRANPRFKEFFAQLNGKPVSYLAHEYLHRDWTPFWHSQVRELFSGARLNYAGDARIAGNYHELNLPQAWREFLAGPGRFGDLETQTDFLLNTQFRRDVFVKGPGRVGGMRPPGYLRNERLARAAVQLTDPLKYSAASIDLAPIHRALAAQAEKQPLGIGDIEAIGRELGIDLRTAAGAAQALVAAGVLVPSRATHYPNGKSQSNGISEFNRAMLTRSTAAQGAFLACPVSGGVIQVSSVDAAAIAVMSNGERVTPETLRAALNGQGMTLLENGQAISDPEILKQKLSAQVENFGPKAAYLAQLGVVPGIAAA